MLQAGSSHLLPPPPFLRPVFTQPASLVMMVAVVERRWQQQASWRPVGKAGWEGSQLELSEACQGCQGARRAPFFSTRCCNREDTWTHTGKKMCQNATHKMIFMDFLFHNLLCEHLHHMCTFRPRSPSRICKQWNIYYHYFFKFQAQFYCDK